MANEIHLLLGKNPSTAGIVKFYRMVGSEWVEQSTYYADTHETVRIQAFNITGQGYVFDHWQWTENGETLVSSVNPLGVYFDAQPPLGEERFVAYYRTATYTVSATADPTSGGTIDGTGTYNIDTSYTLTAMPSVNWYLVRWLNSQGQSVSTDLTLTGSSSTENATISYTAEFASYNSTTVSVEVRPTAGGTISGEATYSYNTQYTLTATANSGYVFDGWYDSSGSVLLSSSPTYTDRAIGNAYAYYVAKFSVAPTPVGYYDVVVTSNPLAGGTLSGGGSYSTANTFTINATPNSGYTFNNWTDSSGSVVATTQSYTGTAGAVGDVLTYTANFTAVTPPTPSYTYTIEWNLNGTLEGTTLVNTSSPLTTLTTSISSATVTLLENAVSIATHTYAKTITSANITTNGYTITINAIATITPVTFTTGLYQMSCDENYVDKSNYLTLVQAISGTLRDGTTILQPSLVLELDSLPQFNYVYIENMHRFYFVRDIQSIRQNLWKIDLDVDVLMTYRTTIKNQTGLIARNEFTYDNELQDNKVLTENGIDTTIIQATGSFMDNNGSICLSVVRET